jgi:branched-chain amino acid transport system permease protein
MADFLLNSLCRGAIYALIALGYTMVYGILGMINFAHGEIFMIGMFSCVFGIGIATSLWGPVVGVNFIIGAVFAVIMSCGFGYLNERIAYRKLRGAHVLAPIVSALGMSIILQNFIMLSVSKDQMVFPHTDSRWLTTLHWKIAGVTINGTQASILGLSILFMAALFILVNKTRLGIAMRATAQDPLMASLVGISLNRIVVSTFMIGSALASLAGVLVGVYNGVMRFDVGFLMGLKAFTAAVLGGIGNVPGAVLGGFIIGFVEDSTSAAIGSDWKNVTVFLILMLVLILRPRGLLGERVADKV